MKTNLKDIGRSSEQPWLDIPVISTDEVYHVGTLNKDDKAIRFTDSYEGHCLSVSHCPGNWIVIAKLGGYQTHLMTKAGALFLDVHATRENRQLNEAITKWGLDSSYCKSAAMWQAWCLDCETDEWRYSLHPTQDEALHELGLDDPEDAGEDGPEGGPAIQKQETLLATEGLNKLLGLNVDKNSDCFDLVAILWAQEHYPDLDGAWWLDNFDPSSLRAPRGGIFPNKVDQWQAKVVERAISIEHEDEIEPQISRMMLSAAAPQPTEMVTIKARVRAGDIVMNEKTKPRLVAKFAQDYLAGTPVDPIDIGWEKTDHWTTGPTGEMTKTGHGHFLADGHHRLGGFLKVYGPDAEIDVHMRIPADQVTDRLQCRHEANEESSDDRVCDRPRG